MVEKRAKYEQRARYEKTARCGTKARYEKERGRVVMRTERRVK